MVLIMSLEGKESLRLSASVEGHGHALSFVACNKSGWKQPRYLPTNYALTCLLS
jgi:hypothetical protein